jgi:acyl-coenzyme A thioesterase 13
MSIVDTVGSLAIASRGHFMTGVSTGEKHRSLPLIQPWLKWFIPDITTSFVRPGGSTGGNLNIRAKVVGFGTSTELARG